MSNDTKIDAIIALAEHPRTEETLRAVAVNRMATLFKGSSPEPGIILHSESLVARALDVTSDWEDRLKAISGLSRLVRFTAQMLKEHSTSVTTKAGYQLPDVWYGDKYDRSLNLVQIAKLVRAEIKLARDLAKLPADGALAIPDIFDGVPECIKCSVTSSYQGHGSIKIVLKGVPQDWGWYWGVDERDYVWRQERWLETDELRALIKGLEMMLNAYNYDGSDAQVDYFNVNFYPSVRPDWQDVPRKAPVAS